ncbi:MAG: DUF2905 domain-containing protein [Acidobacteria bacterium]|nr:DUF2905 domain-containing protein [Acidobacteriota bacterium]
MAKFFIALGLVFLAIGLILNFAGHLSFLKLGRLPGDLVFKRDTFTFYLPLTTSIVLSILLTLILSFFFRR